MTYPRWPSAISAARSARLATSRSCSSVFGSWLPKISIWRIWFVPTLKGGPIKALPLRAVSCGPMLQHGKITGLGPTLRPESVKRAWERDRFPDVRNAANPRDRALDPEPKPRMHKRAVLPQIEIPRVRLLRQPLGANAGEQLVVVVLALAAADDLAVALGREAVVVQHRARIGRILLHVKRLHRFRIVVDEHGTIVLLREQRLVIPAEIATPLHVGAQLFELRHRIGVREAVKRRDDALQRRDVSAQLDQLAPPSLETAGHDVRNELLLQPHVRVGIVPGNLGLDHPELGEMPPGLRFLGAKRRPEAVDFAERRGGGFDVQLPGLREIRFAEIEVIDREQRSRVLAD